MCKPHSSRNLYFYPVQTEKCNRLRNFVCFFFAITLIELSSLKLIFLINALPPKKKTSKRNKTNENEG